MKCLAWNPDSCSTQQIELIASDERHVRSHCPVLSQFHWFSRTCLLHSAQCRAARSLSPPSTTFDQPCRQKFVGALFTWQVLCNLCSLSQIYFAPCHRYTLCNTLKLIRKKVQRRCRICPSKAVVMTAGCAGSFMLSVAFAVFLQCTPPRCKRENVGHAGSRSKIVGVVWGFSKKFAETKICRQRRDSNPRRETLVD